MVSLMEKFSSSLVKLYPNDIKYIIVVMTNKSVKMTTLKIPTQMLRTRLRLTGLNNGFEVLCELKKRKKNNF